MTISIYKNNIPHYIDNNDNNNNYNNDNYNNNNFVNSVLIQQEFLKANLKEIKFSISVQVMLTHHQNNPWSTKLFPTTGENTSIIQKKASEICKADYI